MRRLSVRIWLMGVSSQKKKLVFAAKNRKQTHKVVIINFCSSLFCLLHLFIILKLCSMSYEIESSMYPSWCKENEMSIDDVEIYSIFKYLGSTFGFQLDNVKNMFDFFMCQLDSRSSRMLCPNALLSIHADYIGGENSNYKKWFFATQFHFNGSKKVEMSNSSEEILDIDTIKKAEFYWKSRLVVLTHKDYVTQISLYLLIWGESNNIRFLPECICFIYFCAYNCLMSQPCLTCTEYSFLDNFITPIYTFLSVQLRRIESEKDHSQIIGYDDINQFFWNASAINKIKLYDGTKFKNISSPIDKWLKFSEINWEKTFKKFGKSYKERRTWLHLIVNFNRIWIIHITMYWYYTSLNSPTLYTIGYVQMLDNQPPAQVRWTIASLGGAIACALQIFATICEITLFGSTRDKGCKTFLTLVFLMILLGVNIAPSIYLLGFIPLSVFSKSGLYISIGQFIFSVLTFLYLAIIPSNSLFCIKDNVYSRQVFTRSFPLLSKSRKLYSILFWVSIFSAKFIESYFFLILSLKDPIRVLSIMEMKRCNENNILWGNLLCRQQARIILALMYLADLVLFFLDTYLWYIICNCIFSMSLSFSSGVSIFAPWKNIFTRLPERISTKLVSKGGSNLLDDINIRISDIWNSIVLSMYREHILSIDQVTKLVYEKIENTNVIRAPIFFIYQDDNNNSMRIAEFFNPGGESGRRISFFAQSISASIPEPIPTVSMPTFTVLVPHYSEKIILTLKEIIKEDTNSKMSLLEYLKAMKPLDWENFVKDTKILSSVEENVSSMEGSTIFVEDGIETFKPEEEFVKSNIDDLPLYCMGFKNSSPEYLLRTRIWASLRSQTLYRTISGFMNYQKAIQLLHYSETASDYYKNDGEEMDTYHQLLNRKFKLIVAMQRFQEFNDEEREDAKLLFSTYPDLLVSYIEKKEIDNKVSYYSCLLELDEFGEFTVKYRIKLSGNPILGDGKLDNQNHSIIFYRGNISKLLIQIKIITLKNV